MPELGQWRVDHVEAVAHPFRLGVADEDQLHRHKGTSTVSSVSGWYPDPARRFDYRFHNGDVWTADVSKAGRRYVDGLPIEPPRRRGNGLAVAGMVCGITGLTIGWLPFIAFLGLVTSVVGLVCSLVGLARSRTTGAGRGFAVAGIATSALGIAAAAVGILLTVVLVRMIDEFYEPGPVEARLTACTVGGSDVTFTGVVRNQSDEERTYSVLVEVDVGLVERQRRVTVDDVPAGASEEFTGRARLAVPVDEAPACRIVSVDGPLPFGLDPTNFD